MSESKMGAPRKEIDMEQLAAFMRLKPSIEDTAAFFKVSKDTIERRVKEYTISEENPEGLTFAAFRDQNMVHTRFGLIRKAISKANSGDNVMLIFTLKNLCGWRDKQPGEEDHRVEHAGGVTIEQISVDDRIKQLKGEDQK